MKCILIFILLLAIYEINNLKVQLEKNFTERGIAPFL